MARWSVLVVSNERVFPADLPAERPVIVGRGTGATVMIDSAELQDRHLSLVARDEAVAIEVLRGASGVSLNDVQLSGVSATARSGDELKVGSTRLIFTALAALPNALRRFLSPEELLERLDEELARGRGTRPLLFAVISAPGLKVTARQQLRGRVMTEVARVSEAARWGELAPDTWAAVVPELDDEALGGLWASLPEIAGVRARVALVRTPAQAVDAHAVLEQALDQLYPRPATEPVWVDPTMVRLLTVVEELARHASELALVGPPGCGRATVAATAARASGRVLHATLAADSTRLAQLLESVPRGAALLVKEADAAAHVGLTKAVRARLRERGVQLWATFRRLDSTAGLGVSLELPGLAQRTDDVLPLADHFIAQSRQRIGRAKLMLTEEAKAALLTHTWPGNVTELQNLVLLAAKRSPRDEIGVDGLPLSSTRRERPGGYDAAMQASEREVLLEALVRTQWNVTLAASKLGVPRRTLVHRLAKLGLRRPIRSR